MDYLLMGLAATVIVAALMYFKYQAQQNKAIAKQKKRSGNGMGGFANCPVCGTMMLPGENLVTKVFTTSGQVNDQICYIYGCPHCFPVCEPGIKRSCPVCKKNVEQKQYLLARRFNKTKSGTPHVIVNGCGNCNRHSQPEIRVFLKLNIKLILQKIV